MSTLNPFLTSRESAPTSLSFKSIFHKALQLYLPTKTKRLIFLSSVVASIENVTNPDKELLSKLNELLCLSHEKEAINLPMYVHGILWKNEIKSIKCPSCFDGIGSVCDVKEMQLTKPQIRALSNVIINKTPPWMIYGTRKEIRDDLSIVFQNLKNIENCTVT